MQNYDIKTGRTFANIKKYGWIFLVLAVAGAAIFILHPGKSGDFTVTPDPMAELACALEENSPVFIEFYASR